MSVPTAPPEPADLASEASSTIDFGGLAIGHVPGVLYPRDWTRIQALWADELLDDAPPGPILELGTGAGHIGLLAARLSGRRLVAVDVDPVCCALVARNAERNGLADQLEVREATIASAVGPEEQFALVIADPPWVPRSQVGVFPEDPTRAIDGGLDGLDLARECLTASLGHLPSGGSVLVQLGKDRQADTFALEASADGWQAAGRRPGTAHGLVLRLRHP